MLRVVDTNYILRWFLDDVKHQAQKAVELFEQSAKNSLLVDTSVIAEVTYVLRGQGYNRLQITELLSSLSGYASIVSFSKHDQLALVIYSASVLDYEDCRLLAIAKSQNSKIATFDKEMQKTANKIGVKVL